MLLRNALLSMKDCFPLAKKGARSVAWILLLTIVLNACGSNNKSEPSIVGGRVVEEPYPFFLGLVEKSGGRPFCGATLIAEDIVLTAAHCVADGVNELSVRVFPNPTLDEVDEAALDLPVSRILVHEAFYQKGFKNDLALLALAKPREGFTRSINIPQGQSELPVGESLQILGVGNLSSIGTLRSPEELRTAQVNVLDPSHCRAAYSDAYGPEKQICAGVLEGGTDSCRGDSGGPLLRRNTDGSFTIEGLVSFGKGCAQRNRPGVYTRLSAYQDWIASGILSLRASFRDTKSETIRSMYMQSCFSPITELAERRMTGAAVYEYRRLKPDSSGFRSIEEGINDPLLHDLLHGKISSSPGCKVAFATGGEIKFYSGQTAEGVSEGSHWILGRLGDEPGFSFVSKANYDFSVDVSCNQPGAFGGFFWSFDEKLGTASLSTPDGNYASSLEPFEGDLPRRSRTVSMCQAGSLKLELVALPNSAESAEERFVLSVWNARSPDSGLDHRLIYKRQKEESGKPFEIKVTKGDAEGWFLDMKNVSTETLYGWELVCEESIELFSEQGTQLPSIQLNGETKFSIIERSDEFWTLEAGQSFRFNLRRDATRELTERTFCKLNGIGLLLDFRVDGN